MDPREWFIILLICMGSIVQHIMTGKYIVFFLFVEKHHFLRLNDTLGRRDAF